MMTETKTATAPAIAPAAAAAKTRTAPAKKRKRGPLQNTRAPLPTISGRGRLLRLANIGRGFSDWYVKARAEIDAVCSFEGWNVHTFTHHLAILSPRVAVRRNVRAAILYTHSGEFFDSQLGNIKTSLRNWEKTGAISKRAPKVKNFCANLLGDDNAITLDSWMAIALKVDQQQFERAAVRELCYRRVRSVARALDIAPAAAQACIWAGAYHDTLGTFAPYFPILAEYHAWIAADRVYSLSGEITAPAIVNTPF